MTTGNKTGKKTTTGNQTGKKGSTAPAATPPKPKAKPKPPGRHSFADPSDALYKTYSIDIYSITAGQGVNFKAFVTNFVDSFKSNWNSESGVGRMDPIQTFQNTTRTISLDFDMIAASISEAKANMIRCQRLAQFLYPSYAAGQKKLSASLKSPPYFRVKFSNLISKTGNGAHGGAHGAAALADGLFCTIAGMDYSPDFEVGVFTDAGKIYPKFVPMSLELTILHEVPLGWNGRNPRGKTFANFPYGAASSATLAQKLEAEGAADTASKSVAANAIAEGDSNETAAATAKVMADVDAQVAENERKASEPTPKPASGEGTASTVPTPTETPVVQQTQARTQTEILTGQQSKPKP